MAVASTPKVTGAEDVVWDLSPLYAGVDDSQIDQDMQALEADAQAFAGQYRGRIAELSAGELREAVSKIEALEDRQGRITGFARLSFAANTADAAIGALNQKVSEFESRVASSLVFFGLEWQAVPDDRAQAILDDPVLGHYAHHLEADRRYKPHKLGEDQEKLLLEKEIVGARAWVRFFTKLTSAMRFELDGEELTQPQILAKAFEPDRDLRQRAADSVTETLASRQMELTYIFNVLATNKMIDDRLRNYETWVSSRNLSNKAPDSVVDALIDAVTGSYDLVSRHYKLKRTLLGYEELTDYDRYAPLPIDQEEQSYTWDEARKIVLDAFDAFSTDMGDITRRFFDENWIHAAPMPNKRGGAFCSPGVPSANPYIFMSFTGTARNIMTLAHELGHGIHSYLSARDSGLMGLYTPLTTAETASKFAEMLVFDDLMAREKNPAVRLSMLMDKIENTFATVYRQVSMNRFEHGLHTARREEGELSTDRISDIWIETQRDMFGDSVNLRDDYRLWWSYVPHFLGTPGYVYAYAFGELLVLALYAIYQEQGKEAFAPSYLNVLAAGNSDYPDRIMATLGVDLNDPAFWQRGIDAIRDLIDREQALAKEVFAGKF